MTALLSLLVVLTLSLLITRIPTVALTLTGPSRETARFQARSAFTGSAFYDVGVGARRSSPRPSANRDAARKRWHRRGRRLVVLAFIEVEQPGQWLPRLVVLAAGLALVWFLAASPWIDRLISRATTWAPRRYTQLDVRDCSELLHLGGEYRVVELEVRPGDWLADKTLTELDLRREGMMVLAVERPAGAFVGVPTGETLVRPGDTLVLYGRTPALAELDRRRAALRGRTRAPRPSPSSAVSRRLRPNPTLPHPGVQGSSGCDLACLGRLEARPIPRGAPHVTSGRSRSCAACWASGRPARHRYRRPSGCTRNVEARPAEPGAEPADSSGPRSPRGSTAGALTG